MRIAFLSSNAYGMLTGSETGATGGAQIQQAMVGRELAARGHDVYFVEEPSPEKEAGVVDGIRVYPLDEIDGRLTNALAARDLPVRTIPRFRRMIRALRDVDPDLCYRRVPTFGLFPLWFYAKRTGTPYVYGFAHDTELTDDPVVFDHALTNNRYYWTAIQRAIDGASTLVAQNLWQRDRARELFGAPVELISNGFEPQHEGPSKSWDTDLPVVLWVSTLREWKHPEYVLDLADAIPDAHFVIVGGRAEEAPDLYDDIRTGASQRENVDFEGFMTHEDIMTYYRGADIFVNTSDAEGFPNTFLEAWSTATPVVSLSVDPNGALTDETAGLVADGSRERLREYLRRIVTDDEFRYGLAESALAHFEKNHDIAVVVDRYEALYKRLAR